MRFLNFTGRELDLGKFSVPSDGEASIDGMICGTMHFHHDEIKSSKYERVYAQIPIYIEISTLPPEEEYVGYIVPKEIAHTFRERNDVYYPLEKENICIGLIKPQSYICR